MAHWAELDENNRVLRVTVGDNDDPAGDEGYSWLVNNLGGRWMKCSYNTVKGEHLLGGTPFRWTFPGIGSVYLPDYDIFLEPAPYPSWVPDGENKRWNPPVPKPDSGMWVWNEETVSWEEHEV